MLSFSQDTTFLLREIGPGDSLQPEGSYHAIYISNDVDKYLYHKRFLNPGFNKKEYNDYLLDAKKHFKTPLKKFDAHIKDREWFPLMLYKSKYYLYTPSDHDAYPLVALTDSTLINFYWDPGVSPSILTSVKKTDKNTIEIKHSGTQGRKDWLTIHYIDRKQGIVIIERSNKHLRYCLMVEKSKLKNFPVIVNYCKENRTEEWEFDEPNYQKLLKTKSQKQ